MGGHSHVTAQKGPDETPDISIWLPVLLTCLVAIGPLTTDLYLPSLPSLAAALETSPSRVQLTLSLYMLTFGAAQLVFGPMSDRFGRRPVMIGGLVVYTAAGVGCALAQSVEALILFRILQAAGGCAAAILARATVRDIYGPARAVRVLAQIGAAMALAPLLGPILGGYLEVAFGWRAGFFVLAILGVFMFIATVFGLRESNLRRDPQATNARAIFRNYRDLVRDRTYIGYLGGVAFGFSGLFVFLSESSFVLIDDMGLTASQYGLGFALTAGGYMLGNLVASRLSRRHDTATLSLAGALIGSCGGLLMTGFAAADIARPLVVLLPMSLYLFGMGLVMPNAVAGAIAPFPKKTGAASALLGFTQMMVASIIAFLVGMTGGGQMAMAGTIAMAGLCAALALFLGRRARQLGTGS